MVFFDSFLLPPLPTLSKISDSLKGKTQAWVLKLTPANSGVLRLQKYGWGRIAPAKQVGVS